MHYYFRQSDLKFNSSTNDKGTVVTDMIEITSDFVMDPAYQYYLTGETPDYIITKGELAPTAGDN